MDMTQHESEGGAEKYLQKGWHRALIDAAKKIVANSKSTGFEITFINPHSQKMARGSYWQYNEDGSVNGGIWRLANLARDAGLSESQRKNFKIQYLKNKEVGIEVIPQQSNPKYHEVGLSCHPDKVDEMRAGYEPEAPTQERPAAQAPDESPYDSDESIPF